jgi:hypothetical protein
VFSLLGKGTIFHSSPKEGSLLRLSRVFSATLTGRRMGAEGGGSVLWGEY